MRVVPPRRLLPLTIAVVVALSFPAPAAQAEEAALAVAPSGTAAAYEISATERVAQRFTAIWGGTLKRAFVAVDRRDKVGQAELVVQVLESGPDGPEVGRATVPATSVPARHTPGAGVNVSFTGNRRLQRGTAYFVQLSSPGVVPYRWAMGVSTNVVGHHYWSSAWGWGALFPEDFGASVFVEPDPGPTITISAPTDGATIGRGAVVNANFACSDPEVGVDACEGTVADGRAIDTGTLGTKTFTVRGWNKDGSTSSKTVSYEVVDDVAPVITIESPADGAEYELGADVPARVTCVDDDGGTGTACVYDEKLDTSTLGDQTFTVTATDRAGNEATKSVSYTVVDRTKPTIEIAVPVAGVELARGAEVSAEVRCTDDPGGSGIAQCAFRPTVDTSKLGEQTFTVTATDKAGNTVTESVSYTVADRTKPAIEIRVPVAGAVVARGADVASEFACDDEEGGSGLDTCVGRETVDTSTLGEQAFKVTATDKAGNEATKSVTYRVVDRTKPTIDVAIPVAGAVLARGAHVPSKFGCADEEGGSELDTCVGRDTVDTSSLGEQAFTVTATDKAGNEARKTVTYRVVDRTDPTIQIRVPVAGAELARGADVASEFRCADEEGGSELDTCVGRDTVDTSTLGDQEFTVTATDGAGNRATKTVSYTVVDRTDPTIEIAVPVAGAVLARGADVASVFACDDEEGGSGRATCEGPASVDTSTLGDQEFTVTATDEAGNRATKSVSYTVVDRTDPTVEIAVPVDGARIARGSQVTAEVRCTDDSGGSGIAQCAYPRTVDTSTLGEQSFTATTKDNAGNEASSTVTYTVYDGTWPTIEVTTPTPDQRFLIGADAPAAVRCDDEDGGSGLASCAYPAKVDTSSVGFHDFDVVARDEQGNETTRTVRYQVIWPWSGFFRPVENLPTVNAAKAGSAIPVKFALGGDRGLGVLAEGFPRSQVVACDGSASVDLIEETVAAGGSQLRYDPATQRYEYVWKTQKEWAGQCRRLVVTLDDGTTQTAAFLFR